MLTEKRKNELINQFIFLEDGSDGALHCLEIQELAFLCAIAAKLKMNPLEKMEEIDCDKKPIIKLLIIQILIMEDLDGFFLKRNMQKQQ